MYNNCANRKPFTFVVLIVAWLIMTFVFITRLRGWLTDNRFWAKTTTAKGVVTVDIICAGPVYKNNNDLLRISIIRQKIENVSSDKRVIKVNIY